MVRAREAATGTEVPAIAVTAFARGEDRVRALRTGFAAHVAKPIDARMLVQVIAALGGPVRLRASAAVASESPGLPA